MDLKQWLQDQLDHGPANTPWQDGWNEAIKSVYQHVASSPSPWISVADRLPTEEDGDKLGRVIVWSDVIGSAMVVDVVDAGSYTHWQRIESP